MIDLHDNRPDSPKILARTARRKADDARSLAFADGRDALRIAGAPNRIDAAYGLALAASGEILIGATSTRGGEALRGALWRLIDAAAFLAAEIGDAHALGLNSPTSHARLELVGKLADILAARDADARARS